MPVYYIAVVNREGDVRFRRESFPDLYAAEGYARQIAPDLPDYFEQVRAYEGHPSAERLSKVWKVGDLRG